MSGLYQSQAEADDDEEVAPWHRGNLGIILWRGGGVGVKVRQRRVSDPMILRHATTFGSAFFLPAPFHIQFLRKACYRQDVASFLMCYNRSRRVHLEQPTWLNSASATTAQQLRLSNYASATTPQQLRISNYASATTTQQPQLSNHGSATKLGSRFSNYASATKTNYGFSKHASATKIYSRLSNQTSATKTHPLWQAHTKSHLTRHIKIQPLWQVHAQSHLTRHIKIPPPLASTCTVSSYTSYQNPTPSGKYMHSHIWHYRIKIPPPLASTCKVTSYTSYQNPTPSGRYMHSLILHVMSKPHPLWQVHARSHRTRQIKIPPPLASTCTVSSYTSYQNLTPSGKYMHSLILHVISKSHPLWQVHAQSHLTRHIKISPPLASTYKVTSYGSYENLTPSGKHIQSHILRFIWKSHPLWQVHAQSHLTRHIKISPPLASTYKVTSYGSYENLTPSGKHIQSHILRFIWKSHPLWQVHAQSHLTRHIKIHTPSGKYMHSLILHVISESHPLWQVHAQSHLTRHIKIPTPLASTCTVSSYTSYQNPTPSGKYMHSHILHVISKSHPLWQVHAQSHLTRHIKIPPPLASTCKVTSYGSYENLTPSGKHIQSHILRFIWKSQPLWQVHAQSHLTRHIKIPPPLASTCTVSSYTFTDLGLRNIVYEPCFTSHGLRIMFYESWFTNHGLRAMVYEPWFTSHGLRSIVYEPWFTSHGLRSIVYEPWFTEAEVNPLNILVFYMY